MVSFQATTNDDGELVNKPLINLHVTPNGCGLFGCEDDQQGFDPSYPHNSGYFNTRRNQGPQRRPVTFEQLTPSPIYHQDVQPSYHQPQYQQQYPQPQYQQPHHFRQPTHPQQPQYPQKRPTKVRFAQDINNPHEQVHKHVHVHHHYNHNENPNRYQDGGINFAYDEGPFFRTINDTTDEGIILDENNQVKRNVVKKKSEDEGVGEADKAFKFPGKKSKRSADHQPEQIQSVCLKQPPEHNQTN